MSLWARYICVFLFGSVIGSFLNVVIYRLPRGGSLLSPPSHCPFCAEPIRWYDNIPIVSYLLLAGRCRHCGGRISPRYAIVEALTGALFCYILYRESLDSAGLSYGRLFAYAMLASALLASTAIDLKRQIIPDEVTLPGIALGPIFAVVFPSVLDRGIPSLILSMLREHVGLTLQGRWLALTASILGLAAGAAIVYATGVIGKALFRKEAMGQGDVKFMAMVGGFLGLESVVLAFLLACVLGAVIGLILLIRRRQTRIPFGPYLSVGTLVLMLHPHGLLALLTKYPEWVRGLLR